MTGEYSIKTDLRIGTAPATNTDAEILGMALEGTYMRNFLEYLWEEEVSGARYEITLYEDGNIEVEARDPVRLFANSPWKDFSYDNKDSHISELEKGDPITREQEKLVEDNEVELRDDGSLEIKTNDYDLEDVEELPNSKLKNLSTLCDIIKEGSNPDEIPQDYLDDLVTKVQRAAVAWESDSGEEPSRYR